MCGIVGEIRFNDTNSTVDWGHLIALMARRGPDDEGFWEDQICSLGFRRLAILDLSPLGAQPMHGDDQRHVLIFNGELYNFQDLRHQLLQHGYTFRSTGDTEVVLKSLIHWGTDAFDKFNGMFALAFYDKIDHTLLLAVDHAGIKPLYYMPVSDQLVFGSQYNQLLSHPAFPGYNIKPEILVEYLQRSALRAPLGFFENTYRLEPGTWLRATVAGEIAKHRYYTYPYYAKADLKGEEANEAVASAIDKAVKRQMISDVPLGTFISGGIDSPLITHVVRQYTNHALQSFTVGVDGHPTNEIPDARLYAQEIGVDHIIGEFQPNEVLAHLDTVLAATTEPIGDVSLFGVLLVSKLARDNVTVLLSGDGGDESFWGYTRLIHILKKYDDTLTGNPLLMAVKKLLRRQNMSPQAATTFMLNSHNAFPASWLRKVFQTLPAEAADRDTFQFDTRSIDHLAQSLRHYEFTQYLPTVLLKVDVASMHNSIEVRVPLLDREVIATALRVDWSSCVDTQQNIGKLPLRRNLRNRVKHQTIGKRGFNLPMDEWLRGPLRPHMEDLLLAKQDIFGIPIDQKNLRQLYDLHLEGSNYQFTLWPLLNLALWKNKHLHNGASNTSHS